MRAIPHSPVMRVSRYGLMVFSMLGLTAASRADVAGNWTALPAGTALGGITASAQPSPSLRGEVLAVDPYRGASGRLPMFSYTPHSGRETAALLIPALLSEPLWKLDQHALARATEESKEHPELNSLSKTLTRLGNAPATLALCAALYSSGDTRSRQAAQDLASAGLTTALTVDLLKRTFRRERPDLATGDSNYGGFSFPSGHAANAFASATVIAHYYPDLKEPAYVGAVLISASRVTLRRHYVTDVIAGAVAGTLVAKHVLKHNGNLLEWRW